MSSSRGIRQRPPLRPCPGGPTSATTRAWGHVRAARAPRASARPGPSIRRRSTSCTKLEQGDRASRSATRATPSASPVPLRIATSSAEPGDEPIDRVRRRRQQALDGGASEVEGAGHGVRSCRWSVGSTAIGSDPAQAPRGPVFLTPTPPDSGREWSDRCTAGSQLEGDGTTAHGAASRGSSTAASRSPTWTRSLRFYHEGLGLEVLFDRLLDGPYLPVVLGLEFTAIRAAYLIIPGGGYVELLEYQGIETIPGTSRAPATTAPATCACTWMTWRRCTTTSCRWVYARAVRRGGGHHGRAPTRAREARATWPTRTATPWSCSRRSPEPERIRWLLVRPVAGRPVRRGARGSAASLELAQSRPWIDDPRPDRSRPTAYMTA